MVTASASGAAGARTWLPAAALAAVCAALCAATWLSSYDDAYITYAFARNLATGKGWTWGGLRVLGTSSPLFAAALAGLERAVPIGIPVWGHLVSWASALAAALVTFALARREEWPAAGFVLGLAWSLTPAVLGLAGCEYLPGIACVVGGALALGRRRAVWAGVALAAAVALRPELALAAALVVAAHVGVRRSREAWADSTRAAAVALALFGGWEVAVRVTAGSWLPITLAAKRAQAASGVWLGGWHLPGAVLRYLGGVFPHETGALLGLAALGGARVAAQWRRWPSAALIVCWGWLHLVFLMALGLPFYRWYVLPFYLGLLCGLAAWMEPTLADPVARRAWRAGAAALLTLAFGLDAAARLRSAVRNPRDGRETAYRTAAAWIDARYPPGTTVGSGEVGYIGYYGRFRTVDFLGLVNAGVPLDAVRAREWHRVWLAKRPDILMAPANLGWLVRPLVGDPAEFARSYHLEHVQAETEPQVVLFRRDGLAPRGEFELDLLPPAAATRAVTLEVRSGLTLPALALPGGASVEWHLECSSGCSFACEVAARDATGAAISATSDDAPVASELRAGEPWTPLALPLRPGPRTVRLGCEAAGAGCLVAAPSLRGGTLASVP